MNKYKVPSLLIAIGLSILLLVGIVLANLSNVPEEANTSVTSTNTSLPSVTSTTKSSTASEPGIYTDYSPEKLVEFSNKKKVLFFFAAWCPSCRQQDSSLNNSISKIPGDLVILKVNYDQEIGLRQKYGVTIQHTFVEVDDSGNKLQQWNSLYQQNDLQNILDKVY